MERGNHTLEVCGQKEAVAANDIVALNPGRINSAPPSEVGYAYRGIYPSVDMVVEAASEVYKKAVEPDFSAPILHDEGYSRQLSGLIDRIERRDDPLASEFELNEWLVRMIARHSTPFTTLTAPGAEDRAFEQARDYINDRFETPITLKEISAAAGLSPFQLGRVFHRKIGIAPHAYCINVRVNRAKQLLRAGQSIGEVAVNTGFTDQSHLTRWFKRLTGVTPGRFI